MASPTTLNASVMRNSSRPGKTRYIGSVSKKSMAVLIVRPQLGVGGSTPTPRNDSAASLPIIDGMDRLATTMIGAHRLGSSSLVKTCHGPPPITRAAATKSRLPRVRAWDRTMRATRGQPKSPRTTTSVNCRGKSTGSTAPSAIMKIRYGKPRMTSAVQVTSRSHQPPR